MSESSRPTVVVIGGSFAGLQVAHGILKDPGPGTHAKVVLINPSNKWYFNIAAPRIIAKPQAFKAEQFLVPIEKGFAKYPKDSFEFLEGMATAINTSSKTVTIERKSLSTSIHYDYLVIASGSTPTSHIEGSHVPFKSTGLEIERSIREAQQTIEKAATVVIGGAGPVGVEFAGELADAWAEKPGKSITLVTATPHVLPMLKPAVSVTAERLLTRKNVNLVRSRKVTSALQADDGSNQWVVTLDNGEKLRADVYIAASGVIPNNRFIPNDFLSSDGWVDVDENLRARGRTKEPIFAVGDITSQPTRTSLKLGEQVPIVVANVKADMSKAAKHVVYKPGQSITMMVPIGSGAGTGQILGMKVWGRLVTMTKGKDFLYRRQLEW